MTRRQTYTLGRYSQLLGRRVGVSYRDGSTRLLTTGMLVADSADHVFLEAHEPGGIETLRWRIPYFCIISVTESDSTLDGATAMRTQPQSFRRRSPRVSMSKPVVLSWKDDELEHVENVSTLSISRFGCSLRSHRFFQPGTRVRLDYAGRTIEGRVVYSLKDHSTNLVEVGVGFDQDGSEFWQVAF